MEIICVGYELLIGKTLNTNVRWLAKRATTLGLMVKRTTVVGDDVDEIAMAMRESLERKPKFIITTGGLGPTFDDKTLEGIAKALNRRLEVNEKAMEMVAERYETYVTEKKMDRVELTPARLKMATLPEGATPLPNSVGTAPGVIIKAEGAFLIALPGVPSEMEAVFEGSVATLLRKEAGGSAFFETSIYSYGVMESTLAPLIDQVMHANPYVYIKSHPRGWAMGIEVHFSTTAEDSETAKHLLRKAVAQLSELAKKKGGKTKLKQKRL